MNKKYVCNLNRVNSEHPSHYMVLDESYKGGKTPVKLLPKQLGGNAWKILIRWGLFVSQVRKDLNLEGDFGIGLLRRSDKRNLTLEHEGIPYYLVNHINNYYYEGKAREKFFRLLVLAAMEVSGECEDLAESLVKPLLSTDSDWFKRYSNIHEEAKNLFIGFDGNVSETSKFNQEEQ